MAGARRKRRAGRQRVDRFRPPSLEVTDVQLGAGALVVLSYALEPAGPPVPLDGLDALRPSERHVLRLVLGGCSNAEIARARGTSPGTVAKQLNAIYRLLGVHSRGELAARARGPR
jgi:DNA-binding CsgD family transcriptional regulator